MKPRPISPSTKPNDPAAFAKLSAPKAVYIDHSSQLHITLESQCHTITASNQGQTVACGFAPSPPQTPGHLIIVPAPHLVAILASSWPWKWHSQQHLLAPFRQQLHIPSSVVAPFVRHTATTAAACIRLQQHTTAPPHLFFLPTSPTLFLSLHFCSNTSGLTATPKNQTCIMFALLQTLLEFNSHVTLFQRMMFLFSFCLSGIILAVQASQAGEPDHLRIQWTRLTEQSR
ncbi:hypothetical protein CORC01_13998 [Colletotrichum orchidophilum]|uniref:Uncharacterized protein n=1 Tax=Colletotrichum orchidophilum TaxID=1209926 RepID=A0A1G4ANN6_9PEZI|nr:uncharacterized protein CORC01_13998 [Colletotrichum orchidophilum]OHE90716.1 hypothetical protein CORC01_13998 [Colletotrichum orchidophilum]